MEGIRRVGNLRYGVGHCCVLLSRHSALSCQDRMRYLQEVISFKFVILTEVILGKICQIEIDQAAAELVFHLQVKFLRIFMYF